MNSQKEWTMIEDDISFNLDGYSPPTDGWDFRTKWRAICKELEFYSTLDTETANAVPEIVTENKHHVQVVVPSVPIWEAELALGRPDTPTPGDDDDEGAMDLDSGISNSSSSRHPVPVPVPSHPHPFTSTLQLEKSSSQIRNENETMDTDTNSDTDMENRFTRRVRATCAPTVSSPLANSHNDSGVIEICLSNHSGRHIFRDSSKNDSVGIENGPDTTKCGYELEEMDEDKSTVPTVVDDFLQWYEDGSVTKCEDGDQLVEALSKPDSRKCKNKEEDRFDIDLDMDDDDDDDLVEEMDISNDNDEEDAEILAAVDGNHVHDSDLSKDQLEALEKIVLTSEGVPCQWMYSAGWNSPVLPCKYPLQSSQHAKPHVKRHAKNSKVKTEEGNIVFCRWRGCLSSVQETEYVEHFNTEHLLPMICEVVRDETW